MATTSRQNVIEKLQAGWPKARLDELLPDAWAEPRKSQGPDAEPIDVAA